MTSVDSTSITPETIGDPAVVEVSLLVPVKDEVASLAQLVDEVTAAMDGGDGSDGGAGHEWELIFIDDGSTSAVASGSRPSCNLVYRKSHFMGSDTASSRSWWRPAAMSVRCPNGLATTAWPPIVKPPSPCDSMQRQPFLRR
jgi:hypothetical protein